MDWDENDELTDDDFISVNEIDIKTFLHQWMMQTKIGPFLMDDYMWMCEIKRFRETFEKDWDGTYKVTEKKLYNFLNDIVYSIVCKVAMEEVSKGNVELYWDDEEMDFRTVHKGETA